MTYYRIHRKDLNNSYSAPTIGKMLKFVTPILKFFQFSPSIFTIKSILSLDLMFHLNFNKIMNMEMKHTLKDYREKCKIFKIKSILMSTNHPPILVLECCTLRKF